MKTEVTIPAAEPVRSKPKNAFNWDKTDVVEYIKSLGFPKEAAVFEEQVGDKSIVTISKNNKDEIITKITTKDRDLILNNRKEKNIQIFLELEKNSTHDGLISRCIRIKKSC